MSVQSSRTELEKITKAAISIHVEHHRVARAEPAWVYGEQIMSEESNRHCKTGGNNVIKSVSGF